MDGFIKEIKRLLNPSGKLAIVEINKEKTPFGPPIEIRLSAADLRGRIDLNPIKFINVGEYFYLQIFEK